eukprot:GSChrysophyteH1.ASY1.ANO1.1261.1 assembled CDS
MGGGASHGSIEGLMATTMMVGRALAGIYRNPGMYRLQDFHSSLAPRLKSQKQQHMPFALMFGAESDEEDDDDDYQPPDPVLYQHLFNVTVNDEVIFLDDVSTVNEAGWTPLHASCMSFHTATAGIRIITEMKRRGESLDRETTAGPGTFNKNWTALHMACAYNVEPLVEALLEAGANPNTMNSFGYSPLLEACHRGYLPVVMLLLKHGASISHVPPDELSQQSPFAAAPAHAALGESARCGFVKIVELLLEHGAEKNIPNSLGWTPLHEACFYNRRDVVVALLDAGADAAIRTTSGALAYHLSGLEEVRSAIESKGGAGSVPEEGDTVNMLDILHEITVGVSRAKQSTSQPNNADFDAATSMAVAKVLEEAEEVALRGMEGTQAKATPGKSISGHGSGADPMLHSGPMLGNLPSLKGVSSPDILQEKLKKKKEKKKKKKKTPNTGAGCIPPKYQCMLSQQIMQQPVKSPYGHVFEQQTIEVWFQQQGSICPLTGTPLTSSDLKPMPELAEEILQYQLAKSRGGPEEPSVDAVASASASAPAPAPAPTAKEVDDLYEF